MKHQIKNFESGTEKNQPIDPVAAAYAEKLKALKDARHISGMPLDFWVDFTEGLDHGTVARLCSRVCAGYVPLI